MASEEDERLVKQLDERLVKQLEDKNFLTKVFRKEDNEISFVQLLGKSEVWNRYERICYQNNETLYVKCKHCNDFKRHPKNAGTGNLVKHKCQQFINYCKSREHFDYEMSEDDNQLNNGLNNESETFDELIIAESFQSNEELNELNDKNFLLSLIKSNDNRLSFETQSGKSDVWTRFERVFFNNKQTLFVKCINCNDIQRQTKNTGTGNLLRHKCKTFDVIEGKDRNLKSLNTKPNSRSKVMKKCSSVEEKIRLENKTLKNIIKKCLAMIDKCNCFDREILWDKKQINLLITDYNEWLIQNKDFISSDKGLDDNNQQLSHNESDSNQESDTDIDRKHKIKTLKKKIISKPKSIRVLKKSSPKSSPKVIDDNITYICNFANCGKIFKNKRTLRVHQRDIHSEVKRYPCLWPGCEAAFRKKSDCDLHVCCHTNEKKLICDWPECTYKTHRRSLLIRHRRSHTGEKPYKCDWPGCEFKSSFKHGLNAHKYRHTGEKPWKCSWPQCEWSFRKSTHLKAHMLKHTGEKPVFCDFIGCDRRFTSRQAMRFHMEKAHNKLANNK